jgi:hypothetical protein
MPIYIVWAPQAQEGQKVLIKAMMMMPLVSLRCRACSFKRAAVHLQQTSEVGVLKKLSLAGIAKLSRLRYS